MRLDDMLTYLADQYDLIDNQSISDTQEESCLAEIKRCRKAIADFYNNDRDSLLIVRGMLNLRIKERHGAV